MEVVGSATAESGNWDAPGMDAGQNGIQVLAEGSELNFALRLGFGPLFQQCAWIFFNLRGQGVVIAGSDDENGGALRCHWIPLVEECRKFMELAWVQGGFRSEYSSRPAIGIGGKSEHPSPVGRYGPIDGLASGIPPRVNQRFQSQPRDDLGHLIVRATDVNVPGEPGFETEDFLIPA